MTAEINCDFCGKKKRITNQRYNNHKVHFCNMKCYQNYRRMHHFGYPFGGRTEELQKIYDLAEARKKLGRENDK